MRECCQKMKLPYIDLILDLIRMRKDFSNNNIHFVQFLYISSILLKKEMLILILTELFRHNMELIIEEDFNLIIQRLAIFLSQDQETFGSCHYSILILCQCILT